MVSTMNTGPTLPGNDPVGEESRPWHDFYPPQVSRRVPDMHESSLSELVHHTAQRHGDAIAFSNLGGTLSFNDVDRLASDFAGFLQCDLGLVKGDRIVIQMPNLLQYPVALFGALRAGLIVVNANPLYTVNEMARVLDDSSPRAIVALANFADKVEGVLPGSSIEHVVITEVADLLPQPRRSVVNFVAAKIKRMVPRYDLPQAVPFRTALARGREANFVDPGVVPADTAFLQYTGGTTGGPKAAILTHWNLLNNQEQFMGQVRNTLGEDKQSTVIAALPLYHVFALTVNCLGFFRFGAHNVLVTNPRDMPGFVKTLKATRPDGLILVSTLAGALLDTPGFADVDLSGCRITVAGGMAVRSSVAERWKATTGADIIEGYGLTEASPVVSVNPTHMPPRIGTIGLPLPSTDVKVLDDDRKPVPFGSPGELAVKGPQVMQGYWNKPDDTDAVFTDDGWLLTGDIAIMTDDGFLSIVDRKKEIILVSGFNVFPGEIEDAAMLHPGVSEAGAIAVPDEHAGEVPKLFVARRDPELTEAQLRAHLKEHLTGYKRPKYIVFLEELPKTNVGKVLRRALVEADQASGG
jgi:long-chain acyl-CoA synthetase